MSFGLICGIRLSFALMSSFWTAKLGAISIVASTEPSGFLGIVTPADSSHSAARATIICLAVSALSMPAAFLTGANSSLRNVCKIIDFEANGRASKTKLSSFTPFGSAGSISFPCRSMCGIFLTALCRGSENPPAFSFSTKFVLII